MTTLHVRNSISRSPWRGGLLLIPLVLACFAVLPRAQAVTPELLTALPDEAVAGFNTRDGLNALISLTSGTFDTGIGFGALKADTSGSHNTALGAQALLSSDTGNFNTAIGENALVFNTSGSFNMALGQGALANNVSGSSNTAMGFQALNSDTASGNTAVGFQALVANTTGGAPSGTFLSFGEVGPNTAVGTFALASNVDAGSNTAVGYLALSSTTSGTIPGSQTTKGGFNTAVGFEALASAVGSANGDGTFNDAFGYQALVKLTTGQANVGIGAAALLSVVTGIGNTALGALAGLTTTGSGNVFIGEDELGSVPAESNHTYIRNINTTGQPAAGGSVDFVTVNLVNGLLGHGVSSRRYKEDIKPMDNASEALLALKPVTFRYKKEIDKNQTFAFGLIAEDVAKVNPNLAIRNGKGEIEDVSYQQINIMLLNEFLKEHRKVQELKSAVSKQEVTAAQQQKEIKALTAALKEQASQIQKVSAQLEVSKPAPQTALNNQ